jgi:hypothetical protein
VVPRRAAGTPFRPFDRTLACGILDGITLDLETGAGTPYCRPRIP